ncbi:MULTISPECIES: hypothetical protein [Hydrogenophaga]|uniref:hypothetical protein n=1 Tax=Hydrogenophaga TaxID=47420 RepID=UPI000878EA0A|nr:MULTISPECIES: hypothetical protein [unclassified Hydrogenophaga]MBN9372317.1 hypothetical protein [Hydrogenophaga sp.]OJV61248.1 MAG: hypothetical protein BGO22_17290 [Hydrogenophaga sp. 70-12]
MDEQDAFFTHGIVGAPFSVLLGRRLDTGDRKAQGLRLDPNSGDSRLSSAWRSWAIERLATLPAGQPRRRPRPLRRWLERHALAIAALGLVALAAGLVLTARSQGWLAPLLPRLPW